VDEARRVAGYAGQLERVSGEHADQRDAAVVEIAVGDVDRVGDRDRGGNSRQQGDLEVEKAVRDVQPQREERDHARRDAGIDSDLLAAARKLGLATAQ
jgi:hypothetical protein